MKPPITSRAIVRSIVVAWFTATSSSISPRMYNVVVAAAGALRRGGMARCAAAALAASVGDSTALAISTMSRLDPSAAGITPTTCWPDSTTAGQSAAAPGLLAGRSSDASSSRSFST